MTMVMFVFQSPLPLFQNTRPERRKQQTSMAWKSGYGSSTIHADLLFVHLYVFEAGNGIKK
jgi:hypothetical protein